MLLEYSVRLSLVLSSKFKSDKELTDWVISEAGNSISTFLVQGYHEVDATEILVSKTKYVAYAFGYKGGAPGKH